MAQLHRDFDANDVPAADPFELLPDGTLVEAVISDSEMKQTKNGKGSYLALTWLVISGKYEGRKFFDNLNLVNENEKTVKIAERMMSAICHAVGKLKVSDSDELHGIPCMLKLGVEPAANGYEAKNKVKDVKPVAEAKPSTDDVTAPGKPKTAPWGAKK